MEVDEALGKLGKIGRWQIIYCTMISSACFVLPCFHTLAIIYIGKCLDVSVCTKNVIYYCQFVRASVLIF